MALRDPSGDQLASAIWAAIRKAYQAETRGTQITDVQYRTIDEALTLVRKALEKAKANGMVKRVTDVVALGLLPTDASSVPVLALVGSF